MSATQTRTGSCLCEANKFTVKGDPTLFIVCHCTNCKKQTGTAFMSNVMFKEENVDLTGCQDVGQYADSKTQSGSTIFRHFCNKCGSSMFVKPDETRKMGIVIIPFVLIDGSDAWNIGPTKEAFAEKKCSFVKELAINSPQ
ncbi:DUF636 domain-containing protein [Dendrothele bispora CBS 962.96]|uniref:DUF636 domain-containing protein n=1 Tax=Dendrothele bispora (strain CBS 962.96) TaxID=1314807 RepID=A0A4S8LUJ1_DENBC|nr:DUF636 domain-containing protein [Dendrothele bispora CBS 962.96]